MKSMMTFYFTIFFIVFSFNQCTSSGYTLTRINENDQDRLIKIAEGDTLELTLKTNPSTGYEWKIVSLDTTILTMIHSHYIADKVRKDIVGSGGKSVKLFKALKKGQAVLQLVYQRPFEKESLDVKKYTVTVIIQ